MRSCQKPLYADEELTAMLLPFSKQDIKRLKQTFKGMHQRCLNPNATSFHRYGGRGIAIDASWLHNYNAFGKFAISRGWRPGLTIDRIDNDGNYSPENCQFITRADNLRNRKQTPDHTSATAINRDIGHILRRIPVRSIEGRCRHENVRTFPSITAAAKCVGVTIAAIRIAINRGHKSAGRRWEYAPEMKEIYDARSVALAEKKRERKS